MYRALIIGCGRQGQSCDQPGSQNSDKIISHAHAVKKHPGFELAGFYDTDKLKAKEATSNWGGWVVTDIDKAIQSLNIDVAIVATPDDAHYEILKQLAEYPLKLVLCEKPLCMELQQTEEIVKLYHEKNIPLAVNLTRRYLPYYQALKEQYESGEFGKLIRTDIRFNRGKMHTGSHAIDFLRWFSSSIMHEGGCVTEFTRITEYRIWQIELFFEKRHWREERIGDQPVWPYYDRAAWHVIDNIYNFLQGKEQLKCTGDEALKTHELIMKLWSE